MLWKRMILAAAAVVPLFAAGAFAQQTQQRPAAQQPAAAKKPNILVIWGDDIGQFNISAYNMGMMGYRTPNIDSIAREGACSPIGMANSPARLGRAAFVTASRPFAPALPRSGFRVRRKA